MQINKTLWWAFNVVIKSEEGDGLETFCVNCLEIHQNDATTAGQGLGVYALQTCQLKLS